MGRVAINGHFEVMNAHPVHSLVAVQEGIIAEFNCFIAWTHVITLR